MQQSKVEAKITTYELIGYTTVTTWYGERGFAKLRIFTDEKGIEEIKKDPLQDYISFGVKEVNYAYFEVYKTKTIMTKDKIIDIHSRRPVFKIEAGKYDLTEKEEEQLVNSEEIVVQYPKR